MTHILKTFQTLFGRAQYLAVALLFVISLPSMAQEPAAANVAPGPHAVVEATTAQVMTVIEEAKTYFAQDPQRFYKNIDQVLADVIDFDGFARGVMGPYGSRKMYSQLKTAEEKKQFIERMKRFSEVFRVGLVQTYAKGLLAFNGNKIEVLPASEDDDLSGGSSVTVIQHIHGDAEKPYVVQYKMRPNKEGEWKLRNVTIEAINLGIVYQGQFASAVRMNEGDIDKVIDNWSVNPAGNSQ